MHKVFILFSNASNVECFKYPGKSQGPATSEGYSLPLSRLSSCSGFTKPKCYASAKHIQFIDQSVLVKSASASAAMTKDDMEFLAKKRGNAMQC